MEIVKLLEDYHIPTCSEGHKHYRRGWVNVACPFCTGHVGYHMGFTHNGRVSYCFRCGIHFVDDSLAKLLHVTRMEANRIMESYPGGSTTHYDVFSDIHVKEHRLPSNTMSGLTIPHKKYLEGRGFDANRLEKVWDLKSTGPVALLDGVDYGHRVLAPIYWDFRQVTFQARDTTNRHVLKYMACMKAREVMHHKHIVYKHPNYSWRKCLCCEGITDVWRFGECAIATFGIEYTQQQVRMVSKLYDRVGVCFDDEVQAKRKANQLVNDLRVRGVDAFRVDVVGDPGGLSQEEADYIVKQIIKK